MIRNAVLIAGPTASGKSAAALALARREGRVIVNSDSMQVYAALRILTARPSEHDFRLAPHLLYGHVDPAVPYSAGSWTREVRALAEASTFENRPPIFVGGTGLYFKALCEGLAEIPEIPDRIRENWRNRLRAEGAEALHSLLLRLDPGAAARLQPRDGQRAARALEVLDATGQSIRVWQTASGTPLIDGASARKILIEPAREELHARIDARFDDMAQAGAEEEAAEIIGRALNPALSAMKAIGVREFGEALSGGISRDEAISRAKAATRQYAKRQSTWFRHQFGTDWLRTTDFRQLDDEG